MDARGILGRPWNLCSPRPQVWALSPGNGGCPQAGGNESERRHSGQGSMHGPEDSRVTWGGGGAVSHQKPCLPQAQAQSTPGSLWAKHTTHIRGFPFHGVSYPRSPAV